MKTELSPAHTPIADLNLSGTLFQVGITDDSDGSIFIRLDHVGDPTYMSIPEAHMVVGAILAAISREQEEK